MRVPVGLFEVELADPDDGIVGALNNGKKWEEQTRTAWGKLMHKPGIVLDVGAYTGIYAIAAALAGRTAIAFEPHLPNADRLIINCASNSVLGKVALACVALSDCAGFFRMNSRPRQIHDMGAIDYNGGAITVQAINLDLLELRAVSLIKIDVEGHELRVLRGMRNTLERCRPTLIVEVLNSDQRTLVERELKGLYRAEDLLDYRNLLLQPQ